MLLQLVVFFTLASVITTVAVMVPGLIRAHAWASIPLGLAILAGAGWLTGLITQDAVAGSILPLLGVGVVVETRRHLPQWSMLAAQLLALLLVASVAYLIYAAVQPIVDGLGAVGIVASFVLLLLEASALALSVYYLVEILDVFSRTTRIAHFADERVAFVQTPQNYRDWKDSGYLRGLFYSYRYFFDVTMPSRANRNAIIFAGTLGLIRRSALERIGGWDESIITEDAEASLRMLGLGSIGVYEPTVWGEGLMPLSFDGLKKQRFRWALGGIQILRRQWRDLVPFAPHRLRLTMGQPLAYLFGNVHWFSDLLTVGFTALLLLTAVAAALHHRLPVRELTGPILVVPLAFLITGVLRGLWALRRAERCSWGDALRALAIWFALSWVDTLAVVRGLFSGQAAFLRTPKQKEGGNRLWPAIRSSAIESLLAILAVVGAIVLLLAAPALATVILAIMLLFEAWIFGSAPWASLAAEGIQLTPQRRIYLRSAQNTGDRPERPSRAAIIPGALAVVVAVVLAYGLLNAPPQTTSGQADLPRIGTITQKKLPQTVPAPTPAPATPAPSASAPPSESATATASP